MRKDDYEVRVQHDVKRIFPKWFWRQCCKCKAHIKKEFVWRVEKGGWGDSEYETVCCECAENQYDAFDIVFARYERPEWRKKVQGEK